MGAGKYPEGHAKTGNRELKQGAGDIVNVVRSMNTSKSIPENRLWLQNTIRRFCKST
jgi:hypothetical protein